MDGLFRGVLGILIGAGLYSEIYPLIQNNLLQWGDYGKLTIPGLLGVDPWLVIVPFTLIAGGILFWLDRIDS
ncbi:MAG TPA: hypothetical protein VNM15_09970 [Candidatus Binatia bacterium]|nr:hypothetical protein [Candidatus Binatia bacterium]